MKEKYFELANRLYLYFMITHPDCDEGEYLSGDTNSILAFAEYAENIDFEEMKSVLPELKPRQFSSFKKYINSAIENYLLSHAKILAIG